MESSKKLFVGVSAQSVGYALCHHCHMLNPHTKKPMPKGFKVICCRCGAALGFRKVNCIARTWALLITSIILLIPANYYTVMTITEFGKPDSDTIISGIIQLATTGFVLIAALIFIASIIVPFLKITGLMYLLICVQKNRFRSTQHRIWSYRIIRIIGRWSMLDMFVMSTLLAMVQFGVLADVEPGPAATYFTLVVVLTMLAAESFDSRLLWGD